MTAVLQMEKIKSDMDQVNQMEGEINTCNYDDEDVCYLNSQFIETGRLARHALAELETIQRDYVLIKIADVPDGLVYQMQMTEEEYVSQKLDAWIILRKTAAILHKAIKDKESNNA